MTNKLTSYDLSQHVHLFNTLTYNIFNFMDIGLNLNVTLRYMGEFSVSICKLHKPLKSGKIVKCRQMVIFKIFKDFY